MLKSITEGLDLVLYNTIHTHMLACLHQSSGIQINIACRMSILFNELAVYSGGRYRTDSNHNNLQY